MSPSRESRDAPHAPSLWQRFVAAIAGRCSPNNHHWHFDKDEAGVRYCCKCDLMQFERKAQQGCDVQQTYWSNEGNYAQRYSI